MKIGFLGPGEVQRRAVNRLLDDYLEDKTCEAFVFYVDASPDVWSDHLDMVFDYALNNDIGIEVVVPEERDEDLVSDMEDEGVEVIVQLQDAMAEFLSNIDTLIVLYKDDERLFDIIESAVDLGKEVRDLTFGMRPVQLTEVEELVEAELPEERAEEPEEKPEEKDDTPEPKPLVEVFKEEEDNVKDTAIQVAQRIHDLSDKEAMDLLLELDREVLVEVAHIFDVGVAPKMWGKKIAAAILEAIDDPDPNPKPAAFAVSIGMVREVVLTLNEELEFHFRSPEDLNLFLKQFEN